MTETATGDAERFEKILNEYKKAPRVTRDRMYVDAMRDVYSNATKVFVDTKSSNSLLYLPFDKLLEKSREQTTVTPGVSSQPAPDASRTNTSSSEPSTDLDPRTLMRLRDR